MPQPSFESPAWENDRFNTTEWQEWYGEGAQECADIFDIYMHLQLSYQCAEQRANMILAQDELDIGAVREYVLSIYEQSEQGLVEENGIRYGRDPSGRRFTSADINSVVEDLPRYGEANSAPLVELKSVKSRFRSFLESLGRFRMMRFI